MGAKNSQQKQLKFYSLKAKSDETNKPFFGLSEKIDNTWKQTQQFDTISGTLSGAEIASKEYKGTSQNIFRIRLTDGEETSQIEMTHNTVAYSIINTLSTLQDTISDIMIRVYKTERDGKFYGNAYIEANGKKLSWGMKPTDAPRKEPVTLKGGKPMLKDGKQVYDDSAVRTFYENLFSNTIASLFSKKDDTDKDEEPPIATDLPF